VATLLWFSKFGVLFLASMKLFTVTSTFLFHFNMYFKPFEMAVRFYKESLGVHIYQSKDIQFQECVDWTREIARTFRGSWCAYS